MEIGRLSQLFPLQLLFCSKVINEINHSDTKTIELIAFNGFSQVFKIVLLIIPVKLLPYIFPNKAYKTTLCKLPVVHQICTQEIIVLITVFSVSRGRRFQISVGVQFIKLPGVYTAPIMP